MHPSARHHGDGLFDDSGTLRCRYPGEVAPSIDGTVDGRSVLPTLGNGAIPTEVVRVVREAIIYDGYSAQWLAASTGLRGEQAKAALARVSAELVRLYGTNATYDGTGAGLVAAAAKAAGPHAAARDAWTGVSMQVDHDSLTVAAELSRFSLVRGMPPSPVALTTWRQPWVPLFLEWRVSVEGTEDLAGWSLVDGDLRRSDPVDGTTRTIAGRGPIAFKAGEALTTAMSAWLDAEQARDLAGPENSVLPDPDEDVLRAVGNFIRPLDLCSGSLDGLREQLLGIAYEGAVERVLDPDGVNRPRATGLPVPFFGGTVSLTDLRIVDAFGRTLDVPVDDGRPDEHDGARRRPGGCPPPAADPECRALALPPRRPRLRPGGGPGERARGIRRPAEPDARRPAGLRLPPARPHRRGPRGLRPGRQPARPAPARLVRGR